MKPPMWRLLGAMSAVVCRGLPLGGDSPALVQRDLQVRSPGEDSCPDQSTPYHCKKATDWGLCKGWHEGVCLSLKPSCADLKTPSLCLRSMQILGFACRGWGGSLCLSKKDTCRQITDATTCVMGQASLGLECKGWDGKSCLPLLDSADKAAVSARERQRREARANQAQAKAEEEKRIQQRVEEVRKLLEADEGRRLAAKEAMRQRRQARLAALMRAEGDAGPQAAEDAGLRAEEEARLRAADEKAAEAERRRVAEAKAARRSAAEEARRAKFGDAVRVRIVTHAGGREAELKTRSLNKMKILMDAARAKLDLPEGAVFTYKGKEIEPDATPERLGLPDGAVIGATERPRKISTDVPRPTVPARHH